MKITPIFPSCSSERLPMLLRAVRSIQDGSHGDIVIHPVIVADGNPEIERVANKKLQYVSVIANAKRVGWITSINRVLREFDSDYYVYASDDLEFPTDCIKNALRTHLTHFIDGVGVVTLGRKTRCCFGLFGYKFADLFPNRQVFCPDYRHYGSDSELLRTVKQLGLFAYPPERESQVIHHRSDDETRRLARQTRTEDHEIRDERRERGYQWGVDFKLIRRQ